MEQTFNSTRCIRNPGGTNARLSTQDLSTPHGALGTRQRYGCYQFGFPLSTPHGALGTLNFLTNHYVALKSFNSTRCIRNLLSSRRDAVVFVNFQLHTVH